MNNIGKKGWTAIAVVVVIVAAIVSIVLFTDSTEEKAEKIQALPSDSLQVIKVDDPKANVPDKNDDAHINVDMLGQEMKQAKIEVPVEVKKDKKDKDGKDATETEIVTRTVDAPTAEEMNQVTNVDDLRFKVPSLGLDVSYGLVDVVDNVLRPTNFTAAFGVRNMGVPYDQTQNGTSYVVTHTVDLGGLAPGNYFFNDYYSVHDPKVKKGDKIEIGGKSFIITDHYREGKAVIMSDDGIWDEGVKDRLILIICAPNTLDNYVVVAQADK